MLRRDMDNHIFGVHAVFEALLSTEQHLERIHVAREVNSPKIKQLLELAQSRRVPVRREERAIIDRLVPGKTHQGIVAIAGALPYADFEAMLRSDNSVIVVLDGVEDPHNLGAIIRTAEACHASGIVVPDRHSAPLSATVVKASAGATAHFPVARVTNLVVALDRLKEHGFWIVGVDVAANRMWTDFDYKVPTAVVLGGEHRGLRRLVKEHCDVLVKLPMLGKIESLNASVAVAVVLYEIVRQRTIPQGLGLQEVGSNK